jgi:hypothetical protein
VTVGIGAATSINPAPTGTSAAAATSKKPRGRPKKIEDSAIATALLATNTNEPQTQMCTKKGYGVEEKNKDSKNITKISINTPLTKSTLKSKKGIKLMEMFIEEQGFDLARFDKQIVGNKRGDVLAEKVLRIWALHAETGSGGDVTVAASSDSELSSLKRDRYEDSDDDGSEEQARAPLKKRQLFLEATKTPGRDQKNWRNGTTKAKSQSPLETSEKPLFSNPSASTNLDQHEVQVDVATTASSPTAHAPHASGDFASDKDDDSESDKELEDAAYRRCFATATAKSRAWFNTTRWLWLLSMHALKNIESNGDAFNYSPGCGSKSTGSNDQSAASKALAQCRVQGGFLEDPIGELILTKDIQLTILYMMRRAREMLDCCAYGPDPTYKYRYVKTDEATTQKYKHLKEEYLERRSSLIDLIEDEVIWDGGLENYSYEAAARMIEDAFPLMGHLQVTTTLGFWNGLLD